MVCQQHFDKNFTVPHWDTERLDELRAVREDNVIGGVSVPVRELGRVILRQHHYRHGREAGFESVQKCWVNGEGFFRLIANL